MATVDTAAPGLLGSGAASQELARSWRRLTRVATAVALLTLPALVVWLLVVTTTGYVGLATMLAAGILPVWVAATGRLPEDAALCQFLVALALFIVYTHRGNIQRLREGRENRLEKAMLWRRPR